MVIEKIKMSPAAALGETTSPPTTARTRRAVEDEMYKADKTLKRYATTIDRALATWEISPEEWADYIAFLGRLLKAIQTHPKDPSVLPRSNAIATRLAQCLNPALPSGVHQKALEVYGYVFSTFGNEYISGHLHEFLPGLSAVLAFASLSVRPGLYTLFEDHIVALSPLDLRPALKSLILGLIPPLEEENSEDFERAFNILQSFEVLFTPQIDSDDLNQETDGYFWQCLFLAVVTSPTRRQGALNFLTRRLPKLTSRASGDDGKASQKLSHDAQCIISPEPGLLVRSFVCGLSDPQVLIQRGFLDLLVTHLPLHSIILQEKVGDDDLDRLVSAAIQVLMRRDMSLNRRLWTWFLGPAPKENVSSDQATSPILQTKSSNEAGASAQLRYFSSFGKASLQRCVLKMLQDPTKEPSQRARPFRICLSLMDRWEIGGLLMPQIFLPAMKTLYEFSLIAPSSDVAEVVRSASLFFDGVEASLIWECLLGIIHDILEEGKSPEHAIRLFAWMINTFNIKDEEMLTTHIPYAILYLLSSLDSIPLTQSVQTEILTSTTLLLDSVPARVFRSEDATSGKSYRAGSEGSKAVRKAIINFYRSGHRASGKTNAPFTGCNIFSLSTAAAVQICSAALASTNNETFTKVTVLLLALIAKVEDTSSLDFSPLWNAMLEAFDTTQEQPHIPFPIAQSSIALLATFGGSANLDVSSETALKLEPGLTSLLWKHISPECPKYHVEAVKAMWQLEQIITPSDALIASLSRLVKEAAAEPPCELRNATPEKYRRFMVLWGHSIPAGNARVGVGRRSSGTSALTDAKRIQRALDVLAQPLLLALDRLASPADTAYDMLKSWVQTVPSLDSIFTVLFQGTLQPVKAVSTRENSTMHSMQRRMDDDILELEYYLGQFQNLLNLGNPWMWRCLSRMLVADTNAMEKEGMVLLAEICVQMLFTDLHSSRSLNQRIIALLDLLLSGPVAVELKPLELDAILLERLMVCITCEQQALQGGLLRLVQLALKVRLLSAPTEPAAESRRRSSLASRQPSMAPNSRPTTSSSSTVPSPYAPPQLFTCIRVGFSSPRTRFHLDEWLTFLADILPTFADAIFTNLLPLVECFSQELSRAHEEMIMLSQKVEPAAAIAPEIVAIGLLDALEMVLDRAYECLIAETSSEAASKESEAKPGFLSNVTAGVFKAEGPPSRTTKSNSRLTVILALQDAIRVSMRIWLWASSSTEAKDFDSRSSATTAYHAQKVRNKTRHLLEQIFSVEPLESLEVIVAHWCGASADAEAASTLSLLHVMQVTRPKNVVPAILDALCSRTNPVAIPSARHSSLTIDLSPSETATFLSAYLESTEDDAIDELWPDCMAFLRDVLANPLPYRQVLPHLLSIILLLAEKLSNTNFGEQRKMRRDLGDTFQRLLTATFTSLPSGHTTEAANEHTLHNENVITRSARMEHSMTLVAVLSRTISKLDLILETSERVNAAINNITVSLLSPTLRARSFPKNVDEGFLALAVSMARKTPTSKHWKKEVADAFNDPKLLATPMELMTHGWFQLFHQWALHDKDRMPELLTRLTAPSSAGIMFGVGASAARLEADRKSQFTLRRMCLLLLSSPEDTYVAQLRAIEEKLAELFDASPSSSPSAAIKAELFMLCRVLALSVSPTHLAPLWPIINQNLQSALLSLLPNAESSNNFNNSSLLQACKLLDLLIALAPDDFQLHEWLYATDTIDAVYQPRSWEPAALSDQIAEALGSGSTEGGIVSPQSNAVEGSRKRLLLGDNLNVDKDDVKALPKNDFVRSVLRPFLSQLSIHAYEGVYSMDSPDTTLLRNDVLSDILDSGSVVD